MQRPSKAMIQSTALVLSMLIAACGSASTSTSGSPVAHADAVRAFKRETQGFRPAMEGYFVAHLCSRLSANGCKCARAKADTDYVSAADFERFVAGVIARSPRYMPDYDTYISACQQ